MSMNQSETRSILIADTQPMIAEALKVWLSEAYSIQNVVSTYSEIMSEFEKQPPDMLILDYAALDFSGYDELKQLKRNYEKTALIILSNSYTRHEINEFKNSGIRNLLHKSVDQEELFECINLALKRKNYYCTYVLDLLFENNAKKELRPEPYHLTASEIEIVRLIGEGLTNKEIANRKYLSVHTIMTHRKNILRKLNISSASELIMYAIRNGIIDNIEYNI